MAPGLPGLGVALLQAGACCCLPLLQPGAATAASPWDGSLLPRGLCSATGVCSGAEPPHTGTISCAAKPLHPAHGMAAVSGGGMTAAGWSPCAALRCPPWLPPSASPITLTPGWVHSPGLPPSPKPIPLQTSPEGRLAPAPMPTHCGTHGSAQTPGSATVGGSRHRQRGAPRASHPRWGGGQGLGERPRGEAAALLPPGRPSLPLG